MPKTNKPVTIPEQFKPFFLPARYKISYGGRGGAKSVSIATILLLLGTQSPLRILCTREIQSSIADSVHRLLMDQIQQMRLGPVEDGGSGFYDVGRDTITGRNGTTFRFQGLRGNVQQIKSFSHLDVVWCEEAANISKDSWDTLIPTMRDGLTYKQSEIWVSFNPIELRDDTYQRFVVNPPPGAVIVKTNWYDNPFFPEVLRVEMEDCKARSVDDYEHIWEGKCRKQLEGAVYGRELADAETNGQIGNVHYDPHSEVSTVWDLGDASTAIWTFQRIGLEIHVLDYLEASRESLDFYLKVLSEYPFAIDRYILPWDSKAKHLGTGQSIEEMMRAKGKKLTILPRLTVADGIFAVRSMFPRLSFDSRKCANGLVKLRAYHYDTRRDRYGGLSNEPVHDDNSHAADALRYLAMSLQSPKHKDDDSLHKYLRGPVPLGQHGWMQT